MRRVVNDKFLDILNKDISWKYVFSSVICSLVIVVS